MFLFGALTFVVFIFFLGSRKYEFYADSVTFEDGFLHTFKIPYSRIQYCRPVYPMPFFTSLDESESESLLGRVSVMELKVLFRKGTMTIRVNPRNPSLGIDLYRFVNQKMLEEKHYPSVESPSPEM